MASVSFANMNPTNLELTPMRVTFNGVDLGGTLGNVAISLKYSKAELKMDQMGTTVIDRRVSGTEIKITTELAEVQLKDNWKVVFPHANLITGGAGKSIYWTSQVGDSDLSHAAILTLHPLSKVNADLSEDFKFFKAVASAESEITYGPEQQARLKLVWNVLPDFTTTPAQFFVHGDPSIGVVAASGNVASFTGTGGGNISSLTVYSSVTVTETITATCVQATGNGGKFFVNGSVSGPLGLATVGISFLAQNPQVVSFTINDGSPDFAINDVFTINTVASNYV